MACSESGTFTRTKSPHKPPRPAADELWTTEPGNVVMVNVELFRTPRNAAQSSVHLKSTTNDEVVAQFESWCENKTPFSFWWWQGHRRISFPFYRIIYLLALCPRSAWLADDKSQSSPRSVIILRLFSANWFNGLSLPTTGGWQNRPEAMSSEFFGHRVRTPPFITLGERKRLDSISGRCGNKWAKSRRRRRMRFLTTRWWSLERKYRLMTARLHSSRKSNRMGMVEGKNIRIYGRSILVPPCDCDCHSSSIDIDKHKGHWILAHRTRDG